jgi:hypothetical protein
VIVAQKGLAPPAISIKSGCPQQNGRHERMHLTLKQEATKPASANFLQQQGRFDRFVEIYNEARPHQALDMKYPAECYARSTRSYRGPPKVEYPFHDQTVTVTACGRICYNHQKVNVSTLRRPEGRHPTDRRANLARLLHALRYRLLRRPDLPARAGT